MALIARIFPYFEFEQTKANSNKFTKFLKKIAEYFLD